MCFCDFDPPGFYVATNQLASKPHKCDECYPEAIQPGERYERVFGVWEGGVSTFKTCARCIALREFVRNAVECTCFEHGNIRENCLDIAREEGLKIPGLLFGTYRREVEIRKRARASMKIFGRCNNG